MHLTPKEKIAMVSNSIRSLLQQRYQSTLDSMINPNNVEVQIGESAKREAIDVALDKLRAEVKTLELELLELAGSEIQSDSHVRTFKKEEVK